MFLTRILRLTTIAAVLLAPLAAAAQKYTLSGYITDAASGEPLIGAAVMDEASGSGAVSNNFGFYSLTIEGGERTLTVNELGYATFRDTLALKGNLSRNFALDEDRMMLEGATVTARRGGLGVAGSQMSAVEIPLTQIRSIPAIAGEVDLLKVLQLLPGVQSGTEGSAGFYVRGGGADENLLLLDGVPLYNVNHLAGFFSVFNADAIKNVTLYKGNFPARFGSHLSSVVDVRMNDGNNQEFHGTVSVGAIAARLSLEGPIVKGRTSFAVSARRTYADALAQPVMAWYNKRQGDDESTNAGYYFYDLNAKVTHRLKNGDKLTMSFYMGDDDIYAKIRDNLDFDYNDVYDSHFSGYGKENIKLGWAWGNMVSSLRWTKELSPRLFMNAGASYTRYRHTLGLDHSYDFIEHKDGELSDKETTEEQIGFRSNIKDISATLDFEFTPSAAHDIKFGTAYTYHTFRPGISSMKVEADLFGAEHQSVSTEIGDENIYPHELAVYAEDNMAVLPWLKANAGLRGSMYNVHGSTYWSAEPRLGVRALISDRWSVKASYSRMSQYVHLLSNSSISLPTDLWVPVTAGVKPMVSNQEALGVFYELNDFDFSVEGYYKTMDNVIEYRDGSTFLGSSAGWESKVASGRGWSYGVEFLVQKSVGRTTGWVGYTISRTMRQFDREGNVLNGGLPFPAKYDRTHDFNVTVTHKFSERIDLSGTFVLSSGNCGSLSTSKFKGYIPGDIDTWRDETGFYESRNNFRMPAYHRADLGVNFHKQKKHGMRTWNISVYNVYNHMNPFIVYPATRDVETRLPDGSAVLESYGVLKTITIFPVLPSFSYTFKF